MHHIFLKATYLGLCFLFLFASYTTSQTFITTLYEDLGFISFASIYFPYAVTSLISPFIGKQIGVKLSILIGACTYSMWISAVNYGNPTLLVIFSIINGIGCGLLWIHQGIYINKLIIESMKLEIQQAGKLTGIFFTLYSFNLFLGSLTSFILSKTGLQIHLILWVLFTIAVLACIMTAMVPNPHNESWIIIWNYLPDHYHPPSKLPSSNNQPQSTPSKQAQTTPSNQTPSNQTPSNQTPSNQTPSNPSTPFNQTSSNQTPFNQTPSTPSNQAFIPPLGHQPASLAHLIAAEAAADRSDEITLFKNELDDNMEIGQINVTPVVKASIQISMNPSKTFKSHIDSLIETLKLPGFISLFPMFILLSSIITFSYGSLPLLLKTDRFDIDQISLIFMSYGLLATFSSYMWGYLYDRYGYRSILYPTIILIILQYSSFLFYLHYSFNLIPFWIYGGISGTIDIGVISLCNLTISKHYSHQSTPFLFAWYRFVYCSGITIFSLLSIVVSQTVMIIIIIGLSFSYLIFYHLHLQFNKAIALINN